MKRLLRKRPMRTMRRKMTRKEMARKVLSRRLELKGMARSAARVVVAVVGTIGSTFRLILSPPAGLAPCSCRGVLNEIV